MKLSLSFAIIFCLFTTCFPLIASQDFHQRGLTFKSHEVNKDERTSLDLLPEKGLKAGDSFAIEFDLKLEVNRHNYGYLLRIISDGMESLDITSNVIDNKFALFFNSQNKIIETTELKYQPEQVRRKWVKIRLVVEKEQILFSMNGETVALHTSFDKLNIKKIYFGSHKYHHFFSADTPPMSVRDLAIKDSKGKLIRYWKMAAHGTDFIYDETGLHKATVLNGVWEIDKYTRWIKQNELITGSNYPQIATDSIRGRIFVATTDSLYILSVDRNRTDSLKVNGGSPFLGSGSYLIYDYINDRLISYNDRVDELSYYSFSENRWSSSLYDNGLYIQHHNRFIDPEEGQLVLFGGYGIFQYNAKLFKHNPDSGKWSVFDLKEDITPRYLASMVYMGDGQALLLGGYGNPTGLQEASPYNLVDLIQMDTRNNSSVKIGELSGFRSHYAFGNSMVFNPANDKLYTLAYENDVYRSVIRLLEIDKEDLKYRFPADSIPYNFQDTESFCDLFLRRNGDLQAVTLQKKNGLYTVDVYSLLYPPLAKEDIWQTGGNRYPKKIFFLCLIIGAVLCALYGGILYKKNRGKKELDEEVPGENIPIPEENSIPGQVPELKPIVHNSMISLLGGFQAFDKEGNDITGQFTPVIRQLFLYCLLEAFRTGKGVTSDRLDEFFWGDMGKTKAVNNRNVNIRKLRLILEKIGNISLQKENSYWQIHIDKSVYCDYTTLMDLLSKAENQTDISIIAINQIIEIASRGTLLPNLDTEWVDQYKSSFSTLLIRVLLNLAKKDAFANDLYLLIRLADVVLIHDNIDEDSIRIKCRSLYLLGQKGLSKRCYDKFYTDYESLLNEPPSISYESMINTVSPEL